MNARFRRPGLAVWLALLTLASLCVSISAEAWTRSAPAPFNACLFWKDRQVSFAIREGTAGADAGLDLGAVRRSLATWNDVTCSDLTLLYSGTTPETRVGFYVGDGPPPAAAPPSVQENVMMIRSRLCSDPSVVPPNDSCWEVGGCRNKFDCWEPWAEAVSLTTSTFRNCGELLDADIELNGATRRFTTDDGASCSSPSQTGCVSTDLESTVTHELGHALGFEHSEDPQATMYSAQPLGETIKRDLAVDDTTGLCAVYPSGNPTNICATCTTEKEVPSTSCAGCSAGPPSLGLILMLVLLKKRGSSGQTG